jgi:mannose-6-phosphate isomerase-like protein (cupin superfamily)
MLKRLTLSLLPAGVLLMAASPMVPLAQRLGHYEPITVQPAPRPPGQTGAHQGAGRLSGGGKIDVIKYLTGNFNFIQRGVLWPHSSIGEHYHLGTEEMFVILDGDAQFTINGRTSVIKGPAMVPVRLFSGHAVYNPTDKPMMWMNVSVSAKNGGGTFENGDDRAHDDVKLDRIPQFVFARLDRKLLVPVKNMENGTGETMYRRTLGPGAFSTLWSYVDHYVINPGVTVGPAKKDDIAEIYHVLAGTGTVTVNGETVPIKLGDTIPVDMGQTRSFTQTGTEPLELFVNAVSRNLDVKNAIKDPYSASVKAINPAQPAQ